MIKGVIFDLDGVICFTDKYHYLAWKSLADKEGIYFDEIINNRLRGVSRMESLEIILEKSTKTYTSEEKVKMATYKNNIYKEFLKQMTPKDVSDDAILTLKTLKQKGVKIAIGSSSKNTKFILERIGLLDFFDVIVDGNDIKNSKPDPGVFLKAQEQLNINKEFCLVVEDAESGIDAAYNGNIKAAGILTAAKYFKTTYPIEKLSDILKLI